MQSNIDKSKYIDVIITNITEIESVFNRKNKPTIPAVRSIPIVIANMLGMLCFTTIVSFSQSKFGSHKFNSKPVKAIIITCNNGKIKIIANSSKLKSKKIVINMLEIIIEGVVIIICKSSFDSKIEFVDTGCDFKNQKLLPSSEIEGAVIKIVELEKQKINAIIPASSSVGRAMPPNNDVIPDFPVIEINIPITKIKITPIIVLIIYAGVVR